MAIKQLTMISGFALLALILLAAGPVPSANSAPGSTVLGRVKFEGTVPKPAPINMAADPTCAKQHETRATSEDFVPGVNGTLENVVVFISDGLGNRNFDVPTEPVRVEQKGCMYKPHVLAVRANQPLELVNSDSTVHNIHPIPANNREWNKSETPGLHVEETFAREEIAIPVKCNIHPWMRGYIAVFKHPFFSVTGKDGSFDLKGLPPGEYTISAWHEKLGTLTQRVTVTAGETKSIDFVFKNHGG